MSSSARSKSCLRVNARDFTCARRALRACRASVAFARAEARCSGVIVGKAIGGTPSLVNQRRESASPGWVHAMCRAWFVLQPDLAGHVVPAERAVADVATGPRDAPV